MIQGPCILSMIRCISVALAMGLCLVSYSFAQWSWDPADAMAPPPSAFTTRGTATIEQGAAYAAPGAPADMQHLYGIMRYRDTIDPHRSYDLYFSPSLTIWKLHRIENASQSAQYVGGFHYSECAGGQVTAMDRVIMPAVGLNMNYSQEGAAPNLTARTNYGCVGQNRSLPFPADNFAGSGSGRGLLPEQITDPAWNAATQTLFARVRLKPWIFYEGILDSGSPEFMGDFPGQYDMQTSLLIQSEIAAAVHNVEMEIQLRVYPDGTLMLSNIFTDLAGRPWVPVATDGIWGRLRQQSQWPRVLYRPAG
jgi:hypothetical protein